MKGHRNDLESQAAMLVLPVIASLLNTLIPFFFSWLGHLERFQSPGQHIYVTITRYFLLPPLSAFGLKLSDFFTELCLVGVRDTRELWRRIHLLQRLLYTLVSMTFCLS